MARDGSTSGADVGAGASGAGGGSGGASVLKSASLSLALAFDGDLLPHTESGAVAALVATDRGNSAS